MVYKEPPMRFNAALKKFEPDIPQKSTHPSGQDGLWAVVVVLVVVLLILLALVFIFQSG